MLCNVLTCARCLRSEHSSSDMTWSSSTRWVPFKAVEFCTSCTLSYTNGPPTQIRGQYLKNATCYPNHGDQRRFNPQTSVWDFLSVGQLRFSFTSDYREGLPSLSCCGAASLMFLFSEIGTYSIQPSVPEGILGEEVIGNVISPVIYTLSKQK